MQVTRIKSDAGLDKALKQYDKILIRTNNDPLPGSEEANELIYLSELIEDYTNTQHRTKKLYEAIKEILKQPQDYTPF